MRLRPHRSRIETFQGLVANSTHPKQEAEEEKEISDPGVDEGERLRSVQVQLPVHRVRRSLPFRTGPGSAPAHTWPP